MLQKGFVPLIIIVVVTLSIGVGIGGYLVFREKKLPVFQEVTRSPLPSTKEISFQVPTLESLPPSPAVSHDASQETFPDISNRKIAETRKFEYDVKTSETSPQQSPRPSAQAYVPPSPKPETKLSAIQKRCAQQPLIPAGEYQGLLTDVHVHTMTRDNAFDFALKLIEEMNEQGVDRIVIQPNHDPTTIAQNALLDKTWGEIAAVCPRIIPMVYGFNPDDPTSWTYVKALLDTGHYGGIGEIEFQHANRDIKSDPESTSMIKIYEILNEKRLALNFQASLQRDPSLEEKMFTIIQRYPNISFIWFAGCPATERFLQLPNLYCSVFVHRETHPSPPGILQKSIIGSDAAPEGFWSSMGLLPYESFGGAMAEARKELVKLLATERDSLAHGNFDNIWKK